MSYLLDKKEKRKKIKRWAIFIFLLFFLFYFRVNILKGSSLTFHYISRPFLILGNNIGDGFENLSIYFSSKKNISLENEILGLQKKENEALVLNYNSILEENLKMKEIMNRNNFKNDLILSTILVKPNRSLYNTLIIDVGIKEGITIGKRVFAWGNIPIGYIGEVYSHSSKVILFSNPGEKTDIIISGNSILPGQGGNIFMQIVGRGGGNFEMILPRDLIIQPGTEIILPGISPLVLAKVETIISNQHDSYQKVLLKSPVNIFELKLVQVEK